MKLIIKVLAPENELILFKTPSPNFLDQAPTA